MYYSKCFSITIILFSDIFLPAALVSRKGRQAITSNDAPHLHNIGSLEVLYSSSTSILMNIFKLIKVLGFLRHISGKKKSSD